MMGAATEKARLPRFSLVLGIESCCDVDDLSCLGIVKSAGDWSDKVVDVIEIITHSSSIKLYLALSLAPVRLRLEPTN